MLHIKRNKKAVIVFSVVLSLLVVSMVGIYVYKKYIQYTPYISEEKAKIYIYGEAHGKKELLDKEFELWKKHYTNDNMRYLFVELPYYTGEFLNIWMKSENDEILEQLYADTEGCDSHVPEVKEFYQKIKKECPETIFCATDVGHQSNTTGERYLKYLKMNGTEDSEEYRLAVKNMEQGGKYYETRDEAYREEAMTDNFCNAFDKIGQIPIMGIYGDAHSDPRKKNYYSKVDSMAKRLKLHYGDIIEYNDVKRLIK